MDLSFKNWLEADVTKPGVSQAGVAGQNDDALKAIGAEADKVLKQGGSPVDIQKTIKDQSGKAMEKITGNLADKGVGDGLGSATNAVSQVAAATSNKPGSVKPMMMKKKMKR